MRTTISCMQPIGDAATQLRKLAGSSMSHWDALGMLQEAVVRKTSERGGVCVTLGREDIDFTVIIGED